MGSINLLEARRNILMSQPHLATASANPLTFQTDISANLKDCKIYFEPIQEGSGDPSPDNVRPISGWDGVEITRCGKNLLLDGTDNTFWQKGYINSSGNVVSSNEYLCTINPVKIKAGTYVLGATYHQVVKTNYKGVYVYDKNGTKLLFRETTAMSLTFTVTTDAYVKLYMHNALTSELQLELGSEATAYEPYTGTSLTIPFPHTIYGGYVDLVKGEVVETDCLFAVDEDTSIYRLRKNAGKRVVADYRLPYTGKKGKFLYYSHGTVVDAYSSTYNYQLAGTVANDPYNSNTVYAMVASPSDITETDQYPDWIADVAPLQVVYELATPIIHQLTPQVIKTLKGINNIWSDANGNIELRFWKH